MGGQFDKVSTFIDISCQSAYDTLVVVFILFVFFTCQIGQLAIAVIFDKRLIYNISSNENCNIKIALMPATTIL